MSAQDGTGSAADLQAEVETDKPASRLRMVEFLGQATATMIYDEMPISDHFRAIDDDTILGAMDMRGVPQTYFFVLRRVKA